MPKILTADTAIQALEEIVISPSSAMITPTLGVVVATESDKTKADWSYLRQIKKFADKYGAEVQVFDVDTTNDAYRAIAEMRDDAKFDGIIIISTFLNGNDQYLKNYIPMPLDLDCSSSQSLGHMVCDKSQTFYRQAPCTASAVYKLLTYNNIDVSGKRVGVVGRSTRAGRPTAQLMSMANATVTMYHSKSDLSFLKTEDIVISAVGKPKILTADLFKSGQVVVDVGMNYDKETKKFCGDVDYDAVCEVIGDSGAITPVPNGIGPLTNTILFSKLFVNAVKIHGGHSPKGAELC